MLILASQSPRRREILSNAGIPCEVRPAHVDERHVPGESAEEYVKRLAREKAEAAPESKAVVLGADTVVVVDDTILGKPVDAEDARRMLRLLSGREHRVLTGICLRRGGRTIVEVEATRVHFVALSEAEIGDYAASGEPMDKAGAYAIQGIASKFIDRIDGCYFNVVGLPVALVYKKLKQLCSESPS
ncbi:MAG: Maf family protein [Bryobacteraceae bacterium]